MLLIMKWQSLYKDVSEWIKGTRRQSQWWRID